MVNAMNFLVILINNIGDAFLLVWKFPTNEMYTDLNGDLSLSKDSYLVNNYAESALIGMLKIIHKLRTDQKVLAYSDNDKLLERIPNYQVKLGFGLHTGWCIEGAIGSSYKIDATYLSHHVNFASTLEEKTKEYGVLMAISHEFYEICSLVAQKYFRQIDCYKQKKSKEVKIYTVDVETSFLIPDRESYARTGKQVYAEKINKRFDNLIQIKDPNYRMISRMKEDPELIALMKNVPKNIIKYYKKIFKLYTQGDWKKAKNGLNKILKRKKDGPSMFLLEVMKGYNYKPPKKWKGVREIT